MIYLDHAATTPIDAEVIEAMLPYITDSFYNPSLYYRNAVRIRSAISEARMSIAEAIGAKEKEVYFTSGGTEGDNIALKGIALANSNRGKHIIVSKIEHPAVLNSALWLQKIGFDVSYVDVDSRGIVDVNKLEKLIKDDTILVSVMYANNETGVIQPIEQIEEICHKNNVFFHTDAVQAFGHSFIDVKRINADAVTVSGHKIYGPKGSGFLYIKEGTKVDNLISGGKQELGIRPGTENVPAIIGLATAVKKLSSNLDARINTEKEICDKIIEGLLTIQGTTLNSDVNNKLPGSANFSFDNIEGESLMIQLDRRGICVSTGSACEAGDDAPSHVLTAMGLSYEHAKGSLRVSVGYENTLEEAEEVIQAVKDSVDYLRSIKKI